MLPGETDKGATSGKVPDRVAEGFPHRGTLECKLYFHVSPGSWAFTSSPARHWLRAALWDVSFQLPLVREQSSKRAAADCLEAKAPESQEMHAQRWWKGPRASVGSDDSVYHWILGKHRGDLSVLTEMWQMDISLIIWEGSCVGDESWPLGFQEAWNTLNPCPQPTLCSKLPSLCSCMAGSPDYFPFAKYTVCVFTPLCHFTPSREVAFSPLSILFILQPSFHVLPALWSPCHIVSAAFVFSLFIDLSVSRALRFHMRCLCLSAHVWPSGEGDYAAFWYPLCPSLIRTLLSTVIFKLH